ncbi:hypothetical protein D3C86_1668630 [compost metagenome]
MQGFGCPLVVGAGVEADLFQVEAADQVGEVIAEAERAEVVDIGQLRFAVRAEFEQALLEGCQVALDPRLGLGSQAYQVGGNHVGHAPHVVAGHPGLAVQPVDIARLQGNARQGTVHRARGIDFDDTDIAASGVRVQRVVGPQRAQADHRVRLLRQGVQGHCTPSGEVRGLP